VQIVIAFTHGSEMSPGIERRNPRSFWIRQRAAKIRIPFIKSRTNGCFLD
jgi:hypothetical protein